MENRLNEIVLDRSEPTTNRLGVPRQIFELDNWRFRRLPYVFRRSRNGIDQVVVSVRVLRIHLHNVEIGGICDLEHVLTRRQHSPRNLDWHVKLEYRLLVYVVPQRRFGQKRGQRQ